MSESASFTSKPTHMSPKLCSVILIQRIRSSRQFTTTQVVLKPKVTTKKQISKKAAAAKARKKALKALDKVDPSEKLTLSDAITVLRVSSSDFCCCRLI
jgi:hypothetical protein